MDTRQIRLTPLILVLLPVYYACGDGGSGPAILDDVDVEPRAVRTTAPGDSVRFQAFAVLSDGTRERIEPAWSSSEPDVVEIGPDGWATGLTTGAAVVAATYEGELGIASFVIDPDTVAPILFDVFADPTKVNLTRGSATVVITAELRDEGSGTKSVLAVFAGPQGTGLSTLVTFSRLSEDVEAEGAVFGIFEGFLTIPASTGAGTWTLAALQADDRSGNSRSWGATELENFGLTVEIIATSGTG